MIFRQVCKKTQDTDKTFEYPIEILEIIRYASNKGPGGKDGCYMHLHEKEN